MRIRFKIFVIFQANEFSKKKKIGFSSKVTLEHKENYSVAMEKKEKKKRKKNKNSVEKRSYAHSTNYCAKVINVLNVSTLHVRVNVAYSVVFHPLSSFRFFPKLRVPIPHCHFQKFFNNVVNYYDA